MWDGGIRIESECDYDETTNTVSNVESVDPGDVDICMEQFIELPDGTQIKTFGDDDTLTNYKDGQPLDE